MMKTFYRVGLSTELSLSRPSTELSLSRPKMVKKMSFGRATEILGSFVI